MPVARSDASAEPGPTGPSPVPAREEFTAVRIAVTGSIATDHLMTFPGRFADQLIPEALHQVSLSFLVDRLDVRRGGVAANIAFGMGCLGLRPVLVGAVGDDFGGYRSWLERHNVDTDSVYVSDLHHTARFLCTTDSDHNQIASFYTGAMSEARNIELGPVLDRIGGLDLVVVSPNDPEAMIRHTQECRTRGLAFVADPSQQLARMVSEDIRLLVDGAAYLFTNEYESALTEQKTGWDGAEILERVAVRVTTLGPAGVRIDRRGHEPVVVPAPEEERKADPTGVGDAFRAGFLSGVAWGVSLERAAQVGCMLATLVIETVGTQEYELGRMHFVERFGKTYGSEAAAEVEPHLDCPHP
jgi:adenosine kinase